MSKFFISHSSAHKPFCENVATALRGIGHDSWLDAFDIHAGDAIPSTIVDGIYGSDYFVLVVTPEVHTSKWVPWELNIATYREIQVLGRTFVLPGTRVPTAAVRMIAHKNHLDLTASPHDAARALAALAAGGPSPAVPALPSDAHVVIMEMAPPAGGAFSTRRLEEAFWKEAMPGAHPYSFFPAALRGHWLSVGPDRVVIGLDETVRNTSTILSSDGSVRVAEMNFSGAQHPVVQGALLVRKIARFIKLANDVAAHLGTGAVMTLSVRIAGTDRAFMLSYDPRDAAQLAPGAFRSRFDLPAGRPLAASLQKVAVADGVLAAERIAHLTDEMQADLFHPLRVTPHPAVGGGEFSVRYSTDAVVRYTNEALQGVWGP